MRGGRLGDDEVSVGAAHAEGVDAGDAPRTVGWPGLQGGGHDDWQGVPIDVRIWRAEVWLRRDGPMLQAQDDLDQTCHSGRRLQVSDVGFHRAKHERSVRRAIRTQHRRERPNLDRIAQWGACAMRLDIVHGIRIDARLKHSRPHEILLGDAAGYRQTAARAIVVHGRTKDDTQHPVPSSLGVPQAFEDHDAAALAATIPVRARVEGLAPPVRRNGAHSGQHDEWIGQQDRADSAGQRQVALAGAEALTGEVDGYEGRRACGVDCQAGAA